MKLSSILQNVDITFFQNFEVPRIMAIFRRAALKIKS